MLLAIAIAFGSGVTRVFARMLNASLSAQIGVMQSTFWSFLTGLLCSVTFLLGSREASGVMALDATAIPAWAYLGGVVGVLFVALSSVVTPRISAFYLTLLVFLGQIASGVAIDALARQHLPLGKVIGGALILGGLLWSLAVDRKVDPERTLGSAGRRAEGASRPRAPHRTRTRRTWASTFAGARGGASSGAVAPARGAAPAPREQR